MSPELLFAELPPRVAAVLALLGVLLFLALVGWYRAATRTRRRNLARGRIARRAEDAAEAILESLGYDIAERQPTARWEIEIDGELHEVWSRADLLVERDGRWYVADVKSGDEAPDPRRPATRRQLLEYHFAFDVDGLLLVDMRHREVRTVAFPDFLEAHRAG